jgi:hypothetical protein
MIIAAFDIATSTGCADGPANGRPRCWTWSLKRPVGRPAKLAMLRDYADRYFAENRPDAVFYERGLGIAAAMEIGMSDDTMALLRGAIGIIEASAAKARIPHIQDVGVQEARRYLLGPGRIPKGQGKALVRERCRVLGWKVSDANDDEADAACIWAFGCGQMSPSMAAYSTPLFSRQ